MLGEPAHTQYDWKFELLGIPVRVHPLFWLITAVMGMRNDTSRGLIIWVVVVFVSILVHEFGHALVIRYFGWVPRVVLHGFGGLAIHDPSFSPWQGRQPRHTAQTRILISLAGPAAGFALAGLIISLMFLANRTLGFFPVFGLEIPVGRGEPLQNENLAQLIWMALYVNIFWGILNLMPIYPLDGGQVTRELFLSNTSDGVRKSLQLSMAVAIFIAVVAFTRYQQQYMGLMFGYLAYMNYQQLSGPYGGSGRRSW